MARRVSCVRDVCARSGPEPTYLGYAVCRYPQIGGVGIVVSSLTLFNGILRSTHLLRAANSQLVVPPTALRYAPQHSPDPIFLTYKRAVNVLFSAIGIKEFYHAKRPLLVRGRAISI